MEKMQFWVQTTYSTTCMTQEDYILQSQLRYQKAYISRDINKKWNMDLSIEQLFGTTYDDILEASDRLRRWHIDPSKNLKYDLHILSQLIERVNETPQHDIAESQILAIIIKEILKDPREGLGIIAINSSINKTSLNDMLNMLNESIYVLPFYSKVKINELKVSTNKGYCNKSQIGKCTFGDKCRYRHEIDPDDKKKEEVVVGKNNEDNSKDRNKNKDKNNDKKPSKDGHKLYTPNNYNNRVVGPPKGKTLEGQPPRYSNQQQKFLKLFIKNNNELLEQENLPTPPLPNSASWLFNPTTQPTTNPSSSRMYVLKKHSDTINYEENLYRDDDDDEFEWKYNDSYDYLKNEEIKPYDKITVISNDVRISKFLDANVKGDIEYSHANFIVRSTIGHRYPVDHSGGVFQLHYSVNVLRWMEDPLTKSKLQCNEVFRSNNIQLMNLCYQLGKIGYTHIFNYLMHNRILKIHHRNF